MSHSHNLVPNKDYLEHLLAIIYDILKDCEEGQV